MIIPKWLAGTAVVALLALSIMLWRQSGPKAAALHLSAPAAAQVVDSVGGMSMPLAAPVSDVTPFDREAKRFNRYDKDKNGAVSRDEYFANRHKAFAKLDLDHDGKLSFDEYSAKVIAKFNVADLRHEGKLTPAEFATTAIVHKVRTKAYCPPGVAVAAAAPVEEAGGEGQ